MKKFPFFALTLFASLCSLHAADKIRVSSFSTILTEIAEQVGGEGMNKHNVTTIVDALK